MRDVVDWLLSPEREGVGGMVGYVWGSVTTSTHCAALVALFKQMLSKYIMVVAIRGLARFGYRCATSLCSVVGETCVYWFVQTNIF
jgi:hypothetical protein